MLCYADWTNAWTTATVRHCEGLVEVEVTYVGADKAWVGKTNLRVHIRTIHIYLTTCIVNGIYDLADAALEYSVS